MASDPHGVGCLFSVLSDSGSSAVLVERSLYALSPLAGPSSEVFLPPPSPHESKLMQRSALEVYLSFRAHPKVPPLVRPKPDSRPPPMGFLPLQRMTARGVHDSRVYLARFVPPSGFLTLLTVCSSPCLPALFHAGTLMGFHPPGVSPPGEQPFLIEGALPSWRFFPHVAFSHGLKVAGAPFLGV
jgi:hypothetical protein